MGKYSVSLYHQNDDWHGEKQEQFEREPIPDLLRFQRTQTRHYLPCEVGRDMETGDWDKTSQLLLPSDILNLSLKVFYPKPAQDILSARAFLAWVPQHLAEEFFSSASKEEELLAEEVMLRSFGPSILFSFRTLEMNSCKSVTQRNSWGVAKNTSWWNE